MIFKTIFSNYIYHQIESVTRNPLMTRASVIAGAKSRRDDTLLTVGFNLRNELNNIASKSRRDDTIISTKCRPCGTKRELAASLVRRLKSTVNNVPSLRDFSPKQNHNKLLNINQLTIILNK